MTMADTVRTTSWKDPLILVAVIGPLLMFGTFVWNLGQEQERSNETAKSVTEIKSDIKEIKTSISELPVVNNQITGLLSAVQSTNATDARQNDALAGLQNTISQHSIMIQNLQNDLDNLRDARK